MSEDEPRKVKFTLLAGGDLLEDLIQHHNPGKRVSLLQIMYHGEEKREPKPTRSLFDFGEC